MTPPLTSFGASVYPNDVSVMQGAFAIQYIRVTPFGPQNMPLPDVDVYVDADATGSCSSPEVRWTIAGVGNNVCGVCREVKVSPAGAMGATASPCP